LGFPIYLSVHPVAELPISRGNTTHGEGRLSWGQPRLPPQENEVPALSDFLHTLFNAERPKRRVLGGQPRHCIWTNASRGLSATSELFINNMLWKFYFLPLCAQMVIQPVKRISWIQWWCHRK